MRGGSSTEINYTIRLNLFGKIARQEETIKTLNNSLLVLGRFYNRRPTLPPKRDELVHLRCDIKNLTCVYEIHTMVFYVCVQLFNPI